MIKKEKILSTLNIAIGMAFFSVNILQAKRYRYSDSEWAAVSLNTNFAISIYFILTIYSTWKNKDAEVIKLITKPQLFGDKTIKNLILLKKLFWIFLGLYSIYLTLNAYITPA